MQAITNVSIGINGDIEKIKTLEDNILEQYNKNVELANKMKQETEKFAKQANTAIEDYNSNAETKTTEFNNNSNTKTEEFNNNSTEKINAFNSNAEEKIAEYDAHAESVLTETSDLFNALDTEKASGTELYIEDAKPCRVINAGISGMYKQETTTGKNLLDLNNIDETVLKHALPKTLSAGKYIFSYDGSDSRSAIRLSKTTSGGEDTIASSSRTTVGTREFITIETSFDANYMNISCSVPLKNIMLEKSENMTDFEPYTGGIASPNPDYQQVIEQVESVKLNICNKNLLDNIDKYKYDKASSNLNDGIVTLNNDGSLTIDATKATKGMNVKSKFYSKEIPTALPAGTYYTTVKLNTRKISDETLIQYQEGKFTINEPTYIQQWYCTCEVGKKRTVLPQVEVGEKEAELEQHLKTQINIDLKGNKLCAISDTIKDKLLIDRSGNVVLQKNVNKYIFTGNEKFIINSTTDSYNEFTCVIPNLYPKKYFETKSNKFLYNLDNRISISDTGASYIRTPIKLQIDTIDKFKTIIKDTEVYYVLATPEIIDLGQLIELPKTFEGINNIWAETNLGNTEIEIEYVQDVKKLLEKQAEQQNARLDNIEALLSTTQTSALLLDNMQTDLESEVK